MKSKSVFFAFVLVIAVNTSFVWEKLPGGWDFMLTLVFALLGLILCLVFFLKLGGLFIDKFKNRNKNVSVIIIGTSLLICYLFPLGVIRSTDFDPDPYLIASREGAANCLTTIILGTDSTFIERSVCFGVDTRQGTYEVKSDTVFFSFETESDPGMNEAIGIIEWNANGVSGNFGYLKYFKTDSAKPLDLHITMINKENDSD